MKLNWTILLILLNAGLGVHSESYSCNTTTIEHCYENVLHFENTAVPFFGKDEYELEETCRNISDSLECLELYHSMCEGNEHCDTNCSEIIIQISQIFTITGLPIFRNALCQPESPMSQIYLENYDCFENYSDHFKKCHKDFQVASEYIQTLKVKDEIHSKTCCLLTWFPKCLTDITRDNCNENATVFVDFTLHTLFENFTIEHCGPNPDICEFPPLPSKDKDADNELITDITPTAEDLDENNKSRGTFQTYSWQTFTSAIIWVWFSKLML